MSNFDEYYDSFVRRLDKAEDEKPGNFLSFNDMKKFVGELDPSPKVWPAMDETVEHLLNVGWIETDNNGFNRDEQKFRISAKGQNRAATSVDYAEQFRKSVDALPMAPNEAGKSSEPYFDDNFEPSAYDAESAKSFADSIHQTSSTEPSITFQRPPIDSAAWTGPKYVLTDAKKVREIRRLADQLHRKICEMHFPSNSDTQDIRGLSEALVAVCSMAEPELTIIERILNHPKFKMTAALLVAVETIRGALGI